MDTDALLSSYSDLHRSFLQAIMSRAIVTKKDARLLLIFICKREGIHGKPTENDVTDMIKYINSKIRPFSMEIKTVRSENDGSELYAIVNTLDNSGTMEKIGHVYSPQAREVFRKILEMIVESESYGTVGINDCLNMAYTGLKPGDIEGYLNSFVKDQWFVVMSGGKLCPAPRCIAEFDSYFTQNFKDHVSICRVCEMVVFYGFLCDSCTAITHRHCFTRMNKGKESKCPDCKAPMHVVASPQPTDQDSNNPKKRQKKGSKTSSTSELMDDTIDNTPVSSRSAQKRHRD